MITDKSYRDLADKVYLVDIKKGNEPLRSGLEIKFGAERYKVLCVEGNQSNGMQTMAVAPFMNKEIFYLNKRIFISVFFC